MKSAPIAEPRMVEVAAALGRTTEVLAHEIASPTLEMPQWSEFEWRIARAASAMNGISSLLSCNLGWRGPEGWQTFLNEQREQSVRRHAQIANLLALIDSRSRREGVALLALKGAALHSAGFYEAGMRPMGDIDLLIRDDDANAIARVLSDCGYEAAFNSMRHQVFKPRVIRPPVAGTFGEHVDNPIKIEVHTKISENLPVSPVDITEMLFAQGMHAGLNPYPSLCSLMIHLLLHAAGNIRARALRHIQLHDIALLASSFGSENWRALLATKLRGQSLWWALSPLVLTARYYPSVIPPSILPPLSAECPWLLTRFANRQQLSDVSWSNIRIAAFPGLEWSRSMGDAFVFMRGRIWPSRRVRQELKIGTAEIPGVSTVPWYGIPQGSRILKWVFSRPPRVQTLLSVRAALAQES